MVVGRLFTLIIALLIIGSILIGTSSNLSAYFSAANYSTGTAWANASIPLMSVIMPFVPLFIGLVAFAYAARKSGFGFKL